MGWQANDGRAYQEPLWVLQEYHPCWRGRQDEPWRGDKGPAELSGDYGLLMVGKALRDRKDTYSNSNMYLLIYYYLLTPTCAYLYLSVPSCVDAHKYLLTYLLLWVQGYSCTRATSGYTYLSGSVHVQAIGSHAYLRIIAYSRFLYGPYGHNVAQ